MRFLRENLFLVILAGAVVVLAVVAWLLQSGPADQLERRILKREESSRLLAGFRKGPRLNELAVQRKQQAVDRIRRESTRVAENNVRWNQRNYAVLTYNSSEGVIPAFPYDRERYGRLNLMYQFTDQYGRRYRELLAALQPTRPPTEDEVRAKIDEFRKKYEETGTRTRSSGTGPGVPPLPGYPGMDYLPDYDIAPTPGRTTRPPSGTTPTATEPKEEPRDPTADGTTEAILLQAERGYVYVDPSTLGQAFSEPDALASVDQLWRGQVNLWISQDILTAIGQTIEEGLPADPKAPRNVTTSPIKRIVLMEINDHYTLGARDEEERRRASGAGPGGAGPGGAFDPTMMDPMAGMPTAPVRDTGAGQLTRRVCNKQYDVMQYRFSVIMSAEALEPLMRNLLRQNLHTILKVEIGKARQEEQRDRRSSSYYYGPDPVVRVTIWGEVLFLTPWHRGLYDQATQTWTYPPLLPYGILETFPERAKREEDKKPYGRPM